MSAAQADEVLKLTELSGSNDELLTQVATLVKGNELGEEGADRLSQLLAATSAAGVAAERIKLDVSIARGLDYYTGTIFETFLGALPGIGSVCSGGRYDNLAGLYTKQQLPGIGASLGLDRLLAAMEELGLTEKASTPAEVFLPYFDRDRLHESAKRVAESIMKSTLRPRSRNHSAMAVATNADFNRTREGWSEVATTVTDFLTPSGPKDSSMKSRTSRPRSPTRQVTTTSASVLRAIWPMSVDLPTPEPAKRPTR